MTENGKKCFEAVTKCLLEKNITIATMESCTSGLVACSLTNYEGSSAVVKGGFVTYCNEAKILCGVPEEVINEYGVYSQETADEMAEATRRNLNTDIGIGVTGTFSNVDPANGDSVAGRVFYSISYGDDIYQYEITLEAGLGRLEYKETVAEDIAGELLNLIQ